MPTLWGLDTETFLFRDGLTAPRMVCGSWSDGTTDFIGTPEQTIRFFTEAIERGDHLVGVNLAFDIVVIAAERPDLLPLIYRAGNAGLFHDVAIREMLHDIAVDKLFVDYETGKSFAKRDENGEMSGRYSLSILWKRHFKEDIEHEKHGDVWRFKYGTLYGNPIATWPIEAVEYPKRDALRPWLICAAQRNTHRNLHDEPHQMRAAVAIQLMRTWGFRTDGAYLDYLETDVDRLWNESRTEFAKAGIFTPAGTKDTKRLQAMVSAAYGGDPPRTPKSARFPDGQISTDRDTLIESGNPILEKLGSSGKNDKRKTTYIPALRRGTQVPINPEFNLLVATGRVSSDFQQLPQKGGLRESIIARPGTVLASLDYGGLELRTMAERAIIDPDVRFSKLADYLNSGKDAHSYVAGFFLGLTLEEFLPRKTELKAYRDVAKMFNFGAGGGAGGFAIAYNAKVKDNIRLCLALKRAEKCGTRKDIGFIGGKQKRVCSLCVEIAKELKAKWLEAWPEQAILFRKAGRLTSNGRKTEVKVFGSNRVRGGCGYTQWLNTPFQAAGGDGMKRAMWRISEKQYTDRHSALWGSRLVNQIHDEVWIEFPDDSRRHDGAFEAARIMVDTMNEITPHVRNECVPALMRRGFKSATDVYDREKRLRPWWPPDTKPKPEPWNWAPDSEVMQADLAA